MDIHCRTDPRREAVRHARGRNGLDYVELADERHLHAYFLGKLPAELRKDRHTLPDHFAIEGGDVIRNIRIVDVDPVIDPDPERDDFLVIELDRGGDFSPYTLRINGVRGIDPHYAAATFRFRNDCPTDIDCASHHDCVPVPPAEPRLNYLAKDYASFRQLIFDRMALLVPDWRERHVPDIGVTLVELLAYVGDYLSYYQDSVATEAYLGTARQRISVRRHARLVDYILHEGCNARAFVHVNVSQDPPALLPAQLAFVTRSEAGAETEGSPLSPENLAGIPPSTYEWFEPLVADPAKTVQWRTAHNDVAFYTWGQRECCLRKGATRATLLDHWSASTSPAGAATPAARSDAAGSRDRRKHGSEYDAPVPDRALDLHAGDLLILEEVLGARTGLPSDADPERRWAVRLTRVVRAEDPLYPVTFGEGDAVRTLATPVVEIEWAAADALPFALCLSTLGAAPECRYIADVTLARGNVVLVDHGRTLPDEPHGPVPEAVSVSCCECEGHPSDVEARAGSFRPTLDHAPLAFSSPLSKSGRAIPASGLLAHDPRAARAALALLESDGTEWTVQADLLGSGPDDRHFVCEIDNEGIAHLRFGDGESGRLPAAGSTLSARYRIGGGCAGNVGAEAISCLVLKDLRLDGIAFAVRNPLPATGGIEPEPIEEAKLLAPGAFRRQLERAIIAADYASLASADTRLQRAAARLAWTGSWYEADVAVDPLGRESAPTTLLIGIQHHLERYRRMGHDLRVEPAVYVPVTLGLEVCAKPGFDRGHVRAALMACFGSGVDSRGNAGFFHPDRLTFGDGIYLSRIVATAMGVAGVACATVVELHRSFAAPNGELETGVLPLAPFEIAQLDNDPDHPERGQLHIDIGGGR